MPLQINRIEPMTKYAAPKGTFDILPRLTEKDEWRGSHLWAYIEKVMVELSHDYNFHEIRTPIFEASSLFIRSVGETSDIVSKEMYLFHDKGNRALCLRPEGTAAVMRAFAQHQLQQNGTKQKLFYIGPFFRYDRPQAGRYRQFHQFGVEAIGDDSPEQDFEVIEMLIELYRRLGLKKLCLQLNTLGTSDHRTSYKKELLAFLTPYLDKLSPESKRRFEVNPLRILDSKDPAEQALLKNAPVLLDHLDPTSKERFDILCSLLKSAAIPFEVTPTLVRGLDYYNHVVFEVISDELGAQNALGGGGRYNGLLAAFDGPDLPSIGFSTGIERVLTAMVQAKCILPKPNSPSVCLIPMGEEAKKECFRLLYNLRHQHICAELIQAKKLQKALQEADKLKALFAVLIGQKELAKNTAQVKQMNTRKTQEIALCDLVPFFLNQNCKAS